MVMDDHEVVMIMTQNSSSKYSFLSFRFGEADMHASWALKYLRPVIVIHNIVCLEQECEAWFWELAITTTQAKTLDNEYLFSY